MKLVANKPCTLSGKRYFIGEEIPAEAVADPVALEKMGVLTVIRDGIPVETLEECVVFGREYEFCKKFAPFVNNANIERLVSEMELVIRQVGQNGNPKIIFPHFALTVSKLIGPLK